MRVPVEQLTITNQELDQEVKTNILTNFYWSFNASQGVPYVQRRILTFISRQYAKKSDASNIFGDIDSLATNLAPQVARMYIPKEHTQSPTIVLQHHPDNDESFEHWMRAFLVMIDINVNGKRDIEPIRLGSDKRYSQVVPLLYELADKDEPHLVLDIARNMIKSELEYQSPDKPRPNRQNNSDPHESILRKHFSLHHNPATLELGRMERLVTSCLKEAEAKTSNRWYFNLFRQNDPYFNNILPDEFVSLTNNYQNLKILWQDNHPGQSW